VQLAFVKDNIRKTEPFFYLYSKIDCPFREAGLLIILNPQPYLRLSNITTGQMLLCDKTISRWLTHPFHSGLNSKS
jgi:hypothetical protein